MYTQKRLIYSEKTPKGKDIKWILIENIYSLFIKKVTKKDCICFQSVSI